MRTNASRVYLERFVKQAAQSVPTGALVLDAGAGESIYRGLFDHTVYESADFMQVRKEYAPDITYVGDLANLPTVADRFDLVILTQVLEHLPEPVEVLGELRRVLKPGHRIWASAPLFYEEHEVPFDFYRYTQFGLRHAFAKAGFTGIRVEWLEGYLSTIAYELDVAGRTLRRPWRWPIKLASEVASQGDLRHKVTDCGHPKNYTVVATA